ncbi:MAG TPA: hypothetical protein VGE34_03665 [Candidatus Saccharimonadales bacterium]
MNGEEFQRLLHQKGEEIYRAMPWREDTRPYYVLVSELMLQQTQVSRVIPKFEAFIERFPDENSLAKASLADVLKLWQGLGYNRRAKFLHEAAKQITNQGPFPDTLTELIKLPGVGKNTAGAILAYSFNQPSIFVETNIRTVYIHHFFADNFSVDDEEIIELLELTIDKANPRQFYQNLMDYGSWLKVNGVRNISASKHYKKQSPLRGSVREVRGMILKKLSVRDVTLDELRQSMPQDERFSVAFTALKAENLISQSQNRIHLTK